MQSATEGRVLRFRARVGSAVKGWRGRVEAIGSGYTKKRISRSEAITKQTKGPRELGAVGAFSDQSSGSTVRLGTRFF